MLQFFLIVFGFAPLVYLGLREVGGWDGLRRARPRDVRAHRGPTSAIRSANPMGVEWFGLVMGLGFVLSFGYWCTDFLVVQRAMAADSMNAARRTPLIAAVPKMLFPFLVIVPGIIALALTRQSAARRRAAAAAHGGRHASTTTWRCRMMMAHYYPAGMLGLGLTALLASFMSGMAGNVTAFNTVWTYDIYQAYIKPDASDAHYLWMGRMTTIVGIALSVATAYAGDALQQHHGHAAAGVQLRERAAVCDVPARHVLEAHAPGTAAFCGTGGRHAAAAAFHYELTTVAGAHRRSCRSSPSLHTYASDMAQNFWGAIWAWTTCFVVTIAVSLVTRPEAGERARGAGLRTDATTVRGASAVASSPGGRSRSCVLRH